ncbi:Hypothetical predicted protein [Olea europaea subsp. europaea]|uniref:Uncharacterized protein n=1 Tax=Olea europaea subsp. europaea TaxID=158383 RepID=A0A8S0QEX2_OLEEU|nr:Hypothetical predicted protein [Olea europaea subsp. europaea]
MVFVTPLTCSQGSTQKQPLFASMAEWEKCPTRKIRRFDSCWMHLEGSVQSLLTKAQVHFILPSKTDLNVIFGFCTRQPDIAAPGADILAAYPPGPSARNG